MINVCRCEELQKTVDSSVPLAQHLELQRLLESLDAEEVEQCKERNRSENKQALTPRPNWASMCEEVASSHYQALFDLCNI